MSQVNLESATHYHEITSILLIYEPRSIPKSHTSPDTRHRDHLANPHAGLHYLPVSEPIICALLERLIILHSRETQMLVGRVVDRDEAVEESVLAEAFTETAEKWKVRAHFHSHLSDGHS